MICERARSFLHSLRSLMLWRDDVNGREYFQQLEPVRLVVPTLTPVAQAHIQLEILTEASRCKHVKARKLNQLCQFTKHVKKRLSGDRSLTKNTHSTQFLFLPPKKRALLTKAQFIELPKDRSNNIWSIKLRNNRVITYSVKKMKSLLKNMSHKLKP